MAHRGFFRALITNIALMLGSDLPISVKSIIDIDVLILPIQLVGGFCMAHRGFLGGGALITNIALILGSDQPISVKSIIDIDVLILPIQLIGGFCHGAPGVFWGANHEYRLDVWDQISRYR